MNARKERPAQSQNEHIMRLSKDSTSEMLKTYFIKVFELKQSGKEFPVNLDEVWPVVYPRKDHAIRVLKEEFIEGDDFISVKSQLSENQFFPKNGEQKDGRGGHNRIDYFLSVPCMEYFIAKKVRHVFEVYRKVFHKTMEKEINSAGYRRCKNGQEYYDLTSIPCEYRKLFNQLVRVIPFEDVDWYSVNDVNRAIGSRTESTQVARRLNNSGTRTIKIQIFGNTHPAWFTPISGVKLILSGSRKMQGNNPQQLQITIGGLV